MSSILITSIPRGEAPEEIRRAWIGLVLPVHNNRTEAVRSQVTGVMTGPKSFVQLVWRLVSFSYTSEAWDGFQVTGAAAVEVLEKTNMTAAMWWRKNVPHAVKPGTILIFPADCCEVVSHGRSR